MKRVEDTVSPGLHGKTGRRCRGGPRCRRPGRGFRGSSRQGSFPLVLPHLVEKSQGSPRQRCPFWWAFAVVVAAAIDVPFPYEELWLPSSLHDPLVVDLRRADVYPTLAARDVSSSSAPDCWVFECGSAARSDGLLAPSSTCGLDDLLDCRFMGCMGTAPLRLGDNSPAMSSCSSYRGAVDIYSRSRRLGGILTRGSGGPGQAGSSGGLHCSWQRGCRCVEEGWTSFSWTTKYQRPWPPRWFRSSGSHRRVALV